MCCLFLILFLYYNSIIDHRVRFIGEEDKRIKIERSCKYSSFLIVLKIKCNFKSKNLNEFRDLVFEE